MSSRPMEAILVTPEDLGDGVQESWLRQQREARAIAERFGQGFRTVLLADEVGMGKTYAALAVMAHYVFQEEENKRKVLLVVPGGGVLLDKWEQELTAFARRYLNRAVAGGGRKTLRPRRVASLADLFSCLNDYKSGTASLGKDDAMLFALCFRDWFVRRKRKGRKALAEPELLRQAGAASPADWDTFCSRFSPVIAGIYFDRLNARLDADLLKLAGWIDPGAGGQSCSDGEAAGILARMFEEFAGLQDALEPNVLLVGTRLLGREFIMPRLPAGENSFWERRGLPWEVRLGWYVASRLLRGRPRQGEWLAKAAGCGLVAEGTRLDDVLPFGDTNFFGLEKAVDEVLKDEVLKDSRMQEDVEKPMQDGTPRDLAGIYPKLLEAQLKGAGIGLAVVDEAHNWKSGRSNGAEKFCKHWAPHIPCRLLLTATPFQISENELERIFEAASGAGCGDAEREDKSLQAVKQAMDKNGKNGKDGIVHQAFKASRAFEAAWQALAPEQVRLLERRLAETAAEGDGSLGPQERVKRCLERLGGAGNAAGLAGAGVCPSLRDFASKALTYREKLDGLEQALGKVIIRHTRDRSLRGWHCGAQYLTAGLPPADRNAIYETEGLAPDGSGMLSFIGMRAQQLLSRALAGRAQEDQERVHLLGGLNSSYQAFFQSASAARRRWRQAGCGEGQAASGEAAGEEAKQEAGDYLRFFLNAVRHSPHPKVKATCRRVADNWKARRKTLVFCERLRTQEALRRGILKECGFKPDDLAGLRRMRARVLESFTHVEFSLARSLACAGGRALAVEDGAIALRPGGDRIEMASLEHEIKDAMGGLQGERLNRRGLMRLADLCIARRVAEKLQLPECSFARLLDGDGEGREALRYLLGLPSREGRGGSACGVQDEQEERTMARGRGRARESDIGPTLRRLCSGPNIWHAGNDAQTLHQAVQKLLDSEVRHLEEGVADGRGGAGGDARALAELLVGVPRGLRKVLLSLDAVQGMDAWRREHDSSGNAQTMVDFIKKQGGKSRSAWERTVKFVGMLAGAEGSIMQDAAMSRRYRLWRGVFLSQDDGGVVGVLNGGVDMERRVNLCAAFNSPLPPDVLVCTSIGSEGIDLHLECQDVIHHDLPWNPARLEQRTGRVDRVGSLAQRSSGPEHVVAAGVPFLAHDYDTLQYETVLARAQKQEILLGRPDYSRQACAGKQAGNGRDEAGESDGGPWEPVKECPGLPKELLAFFQVDLSLKERPED